MPILLCSMGISWAVVPEAFHALPPGKHGFSAVHVLTTASPKVERGITAIREYFSTRHPAVEVTISRVAGFEDLKNEGEHFAFVEVLYRWMLEKAPDRTERFVCVAGGFKTMSSAMQKAAEVFGAAEVFHVLGDAAINTASHVDIAMSNGAVRFVRLGAEPGWPQAVSLESRDFSLEFAPGDFVRATGYDLSNRVGDLLDAHRNLALNFSGLHGLPFPALALRSPSRLDWLRHPLRPGDARDVAWVQAIPKVELHCHLGGFATHGEQLEMVRSNAENKASLPALIDCMPPVDWPLPASPCGLNHYRQLGNNNGSSLLHDAGCLRKQCELLYAHLLEQRIIYAEIRCSPANYSTERDSPWDVLATIKAAFDAAMAKNRPSTEPAALPECHVNLILIGTRQERGDYRAGISRHLALAISAAEHWRDESACRVVGVDLAGFEDKSTRAHYFREEFAGIHRCGLALTIHAGENDDAEGIWRAVFDLNARRLGHALTLGQLKDLLRSVADRGIGIEMCPYANAQIKGYPLDNAATRATSATRYPLLDYLRAGTRVTVNTDNIGISEASLTDNLLLGARLCPELTRLDVLRLQRNAIDTAFISPKFRAALLEKFGLELSSR
jgi:adenosine deaminase